MSVGPGIGSLGRVKVDVAGDTVKVTFDESADKLAADSPAMCKAIHEHFHGHAAKAKKIHEKAASAKTESPTGRAPSQYHPHSMACTPSFKCPPD